MGKFKKELKKNNNNKKKMADNLTEIWAKVSKRDFMKEKF